jgi:polysaccharide biosynthesis transport protein
MQRGVRAGLEYPDPDLRDLPGTDPPLEYRMSRRDPHELAPWNGPAVPPRDVEAPHAQGNGVGFEAPAGGGFDLRQVGAAVMRHRWLVLGAVVIGIGAAAIAYVVTPARYTVQTLIHVGDPAARQTGVTPIQAGPTQSPADWQNLLRSYVVLEPVVSDLGLYLRPLDAEHADLFRDRAVTGALVPGRYLLEVDPGTRQARILNEDRRELERSPIPGSIGESLGVGISIPPEAGGELRTAEFRIVPLRDAARELSARLEVQTSTSAYMAVVTSSSNPVEAARIVNGVTESFLAVATELTRARSGELGETLERQLESARSALESAEGELETFERSVVLSPSRLSGSDGSSPAMTAYVSLQLQIDDLERDRDAIRRALGAADGVRLQALEVIPSVRESTELSRAIADVTGVRSERRMLLERYTEDHPLVAEATERLRTLEGAVIPSLAGEIVQELDARIQVLDGRRRSQASELAAVPTRAVTEANLRREVERAEGLYRDVSTRFAEARLASVSASASVRVVDWAEPPLTPDSDRRVLMALMALFGFSGAGVLGSVLLDRADRRIRSPGQVEWQLGIEVLGVLPHLRNQKGKVNREDREQAVEAFRAIRTGILFAHGAAGPLVMTVTSPGVGDGKSFTVSNLGHSFAELGRRTVVVDGDVRRGVQHKLLDVERKPGLTDFLAERATVEEVMKPGGHPLVSVIPLGSLVEQAPELLCTPRMQDLLAQLKEDFDVILIDTCPLGAAADPVVLGTLTGNLALVVRSGQTDRDRAEAMLKHLRRFPVRVLGAIVNDVARGENYTYYGYIPGYNVEISEEPAPAGAAARLGSGGDLRVTTETRG